MPGSMTSPDDPRQAAARSKQWPGVLPWVLAWLALPALHTRMDLANLALILVLASAVAGLWLRPIASVAACAMAVLVFNFAFVPPRGTFTVDVHHHAMLLATMLAVSWIVSLLVARQRVFASRDRLHAMRVEQLQSLGEALRDADDPRSQAPRLRAALSSLVDSPATLLVLSGTPAADEEGKARIELGEASADERELLWLALRQSQAMGPGSGRYEEQPAWYLPMRGRRSSFGAARLPLLAMPADAAFVRSHAQALCDQMGLALERATAMQVAAAAREEAQVQKLRNTLLAAISHDYRTPLATILGAASSLHDQAERLSAEQRQRLAATVVDEARQLGRLTDNILQLARLDSPGLALHLDWESAEEIVGTVLRRLRQRDPSRLVKARVERGLPLLRCDAVLLVQLLDNLVDNALKYGGDAVEIVARRTADRVVLAVRDRGPGIAPAWRERIFDVFQRADPTTLGPVAGDRHSRRGAGVGLAVCRAIARAHGGDLTLRPRRHGGSSFECVLPVEKSPAMQASMDEAPAS